MDFEFGRNLKEDKFKDELVPELESWVKERRGRYPDLRVARDRPVLSDISFVHDEAGEPEMVFGFSEVDVAFYKLMPSSFTAGLARSQGVRLDQVGEKEGKVRRVAYPLATMELKTDHIRDDGAHCYGTIKHDLNTYSEKARRLRDLFPRCRSFLVFNAHKATGAGNPEEEFLRHVRHFDGVHELGRVWKDDEEQRYMIDDSRAKQEMKQLMTALERHFRRLKDKGLLD